MGSVEFDLVKVSDVLAEIAGIFLLASLIAAVAVGVITILKRKWEELDHKAQHPDVPFEREDECQGCKVRTFDSFGLSGILGYLALATFILGGLYVAADLVRPAPIDFEHIGAGLFILGVSGVSAGLSYGFDLYNRKKEESTSN